MSNGDHNHNNTRGLPFSHRLNIGTTIHNVFRNINHAFTSNHDSGGGRPQRGGDSRGDTPPLEPSDSGVVAHDTRPTSTTHPSPSPGSATPTPSVSSTSTSADVDMPPHSQRGDDDGDDGDDSMPELRSVSDESDAGNAIPPSHRNTQPVDEDSRNARMGDENQPPPFEHMTGTRRARVDDDGDDARDRRHPSERVGAPPSPGEAVPPGANPPQQPPRPPAGLFGALFGLGPPGPNFPGSEAPPEHVQTGEDIADPSPTRNDAFPGRVPRGIPILTAGFTLTVPLFGPPGNRTGPPAGGQGAAPGLFGMDAAAREDFFASFAAFLQEFQASEEFREDPERAKKLIAGLEVVPLGLVKRLERVGGVPGEHVEDASTKGASSGCAVCWDTLLDSESDNFSSQAPQPPISGTDSVEGQDEAHTSSDAMDIDASTVSASHPEASTSTLPASGATNIISLPCAHVFHASCLLPWFARAKQATCPTCRFNIDPENLTYTPLGRRAFNRAAPAQPDNPAPNPTLADQQQAAPQLPSDAPATGTRATEAVVQPVDHAHVNADVPPVPAAVPLAPPPPPPPPIGPAGPGFTPFIAIPGIPILSFPAVQIPLRPTAAEAPGGGNLGIDVVTIGLDMFVGGLPPQERDDNSRDDSMDADSLDDSEAGAGAAGGNGAPNPNGFAQDLHSLIEGLLRTTRNIIPQVINQQMPVPGPAPDTASADGAESQPQGRPVPEAGGPHIIPPPAGGAQSQARPAPDATGPHPIPPMAGGPRTVPIFPFRSMIFRPSRPMPPRQEAWTLPPAPGPSLRQRVEQREREQGLRCSDTSCGVGPSDEDPYPELSASLTKQVHIHPLPNTGDHESDVQASICAHAFHPACLVSAERVAGWGGEDKVEPLVEVSCPVCRAVGCMTREEWESGVSAP